LQEKGIVAIAARSASSATSWQTKAIEALGCCRGIGVDEFVAGCGGAKREPILEGGGILDIEGAEKGGGEREGDVVGAQPGDVGHLQERAVRQEVGENDVEFGFVHQTIAV